MIVLLGLSGSTSGQNHAVKQFTVDEGLPSSHVYEVKQDRNNFYWISTSEGLVKYDGYSFESFEAENSPFNTDIWWSYEDNQGQIWGLSRGLEQWCISGDSLIKHELQFDGLDENVAFERLLQDCSDAYWMIRGSILFRFKNKSFHTFSTKDLTKMIGAWEPMVFQENGCEIDLITMNPITVWTPQEDGTMKKRHSYPTLVFADGFPGINYDSAQTGQNTTLIYGSRDSLYTIHKGNLTGHFDGSNVDLAKFPASHKLKFGSYRVLKVGNKFAFIHSNGSFMTDRKFNHLPTYDLIFKYNINTIYEDHEGSLWISTTNQGLLYVHKDALAVKAFNHSQTLNSEVVDVALDQGHCWVAYKNGVVCNYQNGEFSCTQLKPAGLRDERWYLRGLISSGPYLIVAVGNYEIQVFDKRKAETVFDEPIEVFGSRQTKRMNQTADNVIHISSFLGVQELTISNESEFSINRIWDLNNYGAIGIRDGQHLVSTARGLLHIDRQKNEVTVGTKHGIFTKAVTGPDGIPWLIGEHRGVFRLIDNQVIEVTALQESKVNDIWFEGDTSVWVASNKGMIQYHWTLGTDTLAFHRTLTRANGLLSNEITSIRTDDEHLYVGSSKGFCVVNRSGLSMVDRGSFVQVTDISARGEKLPVQQDYVLQPTSNSLEVHYVYVSPKSEGDITYEYRMNGIDSLWRETKETRLGFPFLPPGKYNLQLRAKDLNGTVSYNTIDIKIKVLEYWYKTKWFIAIAVLVSILIIVAFFMNRIRAIRKREKAQLELNQRMADLRLNALRSQMNPHFVFNVLTSIQNGFMNNNSPDANRQLTDFAKLLRLFLESADHKFITVEKEIRLISYYLELERKRLEEGFDIFIEIGDSVDQYVTQIPTMLLQPFVENAVQHGLRHKEGKGWIKVQISRSENGVLYASVEDNGVGRKRSSEINEKTRSGHKSKAGHMIEERVKILNQGKGVKIDLNYVDIENTYGSTGTRVELNIDLEANRN